MAIGCYNLASRTRAIIIAVLIICWCRVTGWLVGLSVGARTVVYLFFCVDQGSGSHEQEPRSLYCCMV